MLSANRNVAMTHRSICLPDFPARSQACGIPCENGKGERRIRRVRWPEVGPAGGCAAKEQQPTAARVETGVLKYDRHKTRLTLPLSSEEFRLAGPAPSNE
jgi:hypothetical protein